MTSIEKNSDINKAIALLNKEAISEAIEYIKQLLISKKFSKGYDKILSIQNNYNYLLKYLTDGQPDPEREKIYNNIREQLYSLVRMIEVRDEVKDSPLLYYSELRINEFTSKSFSKSLGEYLSAESSLLFAESETDIAKLNSDINRSLKELFSIVWTLPIWRADELKSILNTILAEDLKYELKGLLVGALIQNVLFVYDRDKFITLLDIYRLSTNEKVKARAIIGILLIINRFGNRIQRDNEVNLRFDTLLDENEFIPHLRKGLYSLIKARGSLKLMRKIENEILPDIMSMGPKFMENINKIKDESGEIDFENLETNPEWDKLMSSGVEKKLRKLSNIQNDGGDIMLSMFAQLSGRFHIFNDISIWFHPFSANLAISTGASNVIINALEELPFNGGLTDIDRLAMLLNFSRLPGAAQSFMESSMKAQSEQLNEELKDKALHTSTPDFDMELDNFSRILFRFYNFYRLRSEFTNPFEKPLNLNNFTNISGQLIDIDSISDIAEFYFRQGFYSDAIKLFENLIVISPLEKHIYCQKIGFAYEKLGKYDLALKFYSDESLIGSSDEWLLKKLVKVGKIEKDYSIVNDALTQLLQLHPENINYLVELATLKLDNKKLDKKSGEFEKRESDKIISQAAYYAPDDYRVLRLMARQSCSQHNFQDALHYISPRLNEISMYFASKSLKVEDGNNKDDLSPEEQSDMVEDLLIASTIYFADENPAEGIRYLSMIFLFKDFENKSWYAKERLEKTWNEDKILKSKISLLPLYIEAALSLNK